MAVHDKQLIEEIIPLLDLTRERMGQWVPFQIDRDREFQKAVHWLTNNIHSPYLKPEDVGRRDPFVVEWACPDGTWSGSIKKYGVWVYENRAGRIRYRTPRKRSVRHGEPDHGPGPAGRDDRPADGDGDAAADPRPADGAE